MFKIQLILITLFATFCIRSAISAKGGRDRQDKEYSWESFKQEKGRNYRNVTEETRRQTIWKTNYDKIKKHNQETDQNLHSYFVGVNDFTDLSPEEFQQQYLGLKMSTRIKNKKGNQNNHRDDGNDSESDEQDNNQVQQGGRRTTKRSTRFSKNPTQSSSTFQSTTNNNQQINTNGKDWRLLGGVSPVKNQGSCGSCWAFSALATIESQYLIKKKASVILSEQNLVDCSTSYGNYGCNGGWPDAAFDYIIAKKGVDTSISYPYRQRDQSCLFSTANIGATISSYYSSGNSETKMVQALDTIGPISVTLNANTLQYYVGGIINEASCSKSINHAVVAVGYGTENGVDYFICKNSWGTSWGENGYFRIARNKNMCGIATYYSYPIL